MNPNGSNTNNGRNGFSITSSQVAAASQPVADMSIAQYGRGYPQQQFPGSMGFQSDWQPYGPPMPRNGGPTNYYNGGSHYHFHTPGHYNLTVGQQLPQQGGFGFGSDAGAPPPRAGPLLPTTTGGGGNAFGFEAPLGGQFSGLYGGAGASGTRAMPVTLIVVDDRGEGQEEETKSMETS